MSDSLRDRIRARHKAMRAQINAGETFPLPGYDNELWIKLRFLTREDIAEIDAHHPRVSDQQVARLVAACDGLFDSVKRDKEHLTRIEVDGVPVRLDRSFAGWMGSDFLDSVTINGVVQPADVLREALNDHHLGLLHEMWSMWMFSSPEVDDDIVGESEPTQT